MSQISDEKVAEWLRLVKLQNKNRKWSTQGISHQEAKKRQTALDNYPKKMMETEDGKAKFLADMENIFYECDVENMGSLSVQDFWPMMEKFGALHDKEEGIMGHWIMDKAVFDENMNWYMVNFGSGGRMTYDQWMANFPVYMEKILPHLNCHVLTDEQVGVWIQQIKSQNATRTWSVPGLSIQEAKKRQTALLDYPKVMFETPEGAAKMMTDCENFFFQSDSENMGSLTGEDFWNLIELFNAQQDTTEGIMGHWILDKQIWDKDVGWYMNTFGSDGRMTFDQWTATFPIYMEKVLPNLKD